MDIALDQGDESQLTSSRGLLNLHSCSLERFAYKKAIAEEEELKHLLGLPLFIELSKRGLANEAPLGVDQFQLQKRYAISLKADDSTGLELRTLSSP